MLNVWLIAIIVGTIIIVSLALYAGKLLMLLKQQTQAQQQTEQAHKLALKVHDKKVLDSIVIIARAMKEEQCDVSEGCWRLSVLLDSLKTSQQLDQEFPAIFGLYGKIKHLSILGERKELVKKQRMQQDLERMKLEAEYSSQIRKDIDLLHQYAVERISVLTS
ncbi:MAG: DUF2489 domain-containing protein [Alteromonadaceae bacterium]|nr:DUF2489 domain-containing protein [Alteromonadaceae bacterium]